MQGFPGGELRTTATAAIATDGNLLVAGHSLDVEMQQIPRKRMFIAHHRPGGVGIAPALAPRASPPPSGRGRAPGRRFGQPSTPTTLSTRLRHVRFPDPRPRPP